MYYDLYAYDWLSRELVQTTDQAHINIFISWVNQQPDFFIPQLVYRLKHRDQEVRNRVKSLLCQIKQNALLPTLYHYLARPEPEWHLWAAVALSQWQDTQALPILVTSLDNPDLSIAGQALIALNTYPNPSALIEESQAHSLFERCITYKKSSRYDPITVLINSMLVALADFQFAQDYFLTALSSQDHEQQRLAIKTLAYATPNAQTISALIEAFNSPQSFYFLRYDILGAFIILKSPQALSLILKSIPQADYGMRNQIIRAITAIDFSEIEMKQVLEVIFQHWDGYAIARLELHPLVFKLRQAYPPLYEKVVEQLKTFLRPQKLEELQQLSLISPAYD